MSDEFRRLLDQPEHASLRGVLEAGLGDRPSARSFSRTAKALGIGSSVALTAISASSAAKATPLGTKALLAAFAKWLAAGALIGGIAASPLIARSVTESRPTPAAATPLANSPVPEKFSNPGPAAAAEKTTPDVPESAAATAAEAEPIRTAAPRSAPPPPAPQNALAAPGASIAKFQTGATSSLDDEIALLDGARRALKQGDPNAALAVLDRHDRAPAPHALGAEATLLRVQALVAAGRTSEAQSLARRVLDARPGDGYACRLAKIASLPSEKCPNGKP